MSDDEHEVGPDGQPKRRHVGPYEMGRTLGEGAFGKVKLGTNIFTGEKVRTKPLSRLSKPLLKFNFIHYIRIFPIESLFC